MCDAPYADPLVTFDVTTFDAPSTAVVSVVAEITGGDPTTMTPLYEVLDPDALDAIVSPANHPRESPCVHAEFVYQDYRIHIDATGQGYVYDTDDSLQPTPDSQRAETATQAN